MVGSLISAAGKLFSGIMGGIGAFEAAGAYEDAAEFAGQSADLTKTSTQIQLVQKDRELFNVLGGQKSDIASSGFLETAGVLDIIRDSAQQGSLSKQLVAHQGLITELGFRAQQSSYEAQATAAEMQGYGSIGEGIFGAAGDLIGI